MSDEVTECLYCGKAIVNAKRGRKRKYCDDQCRADFHRYTKKGRPKRAKTGEQVCAFCDTPFERTGANHIHCSERCTVLASQFRTLLSKDDTPAQTSGIERALNVALKRCASKRGVPWFAK